MKFTKNQLKNWAKYESVKKNGKWNMFSPNARFVAGLEKDEYSFCMENYTELKKEYNKDGK